ncbi:MAG: hypothetical protein K1X67_06420 [Fimbriimonadaceae bacterium]|nr:hypothetical protein [Fimbriimonadaceae bacterium]
MMTPIKDDCNPPQNLVAPKGFLTKRHQEEMPNVLDDPEEEQKSASVEEVEQALSQISKPKLGPAIRSSASHPSAAEANSSSFNGETAAAFIEGLTQALSAIPSNPVSKPSSSLDESGLPNAPAVSTAEANTT